MEPIIPSFSSACSPRHWVTVTFLLLLKQAKLSLPQGLDTGSYLPLYHTLNIPPHVCTSLHKT